MKKSILVSVIVTTYNWPEALSLVLQSLGEQSYKNIEIIIADDGSRDDTRVCIRKYEQQYSIKLMHVWQEDNGFQAAKIRNKAVALSKGDYLIFLDGDCIATKNFVARHVRLAEVGYLVAGNRILLSEYFTAEILKKKLRIQDLNFSQWLTLKKLRYCNRLSPLLFLPLFPRKLRLNRWQGAKTCNLGLWRNDFLNVNGFDEIFQGWGHEDSDLVVRLFHAGIKRKDGRFAAPVIHLWHPENDRSSQKDNLARFEQRLAGVSTQAILGIQQYLGENKCPF